MKTKLQMLAEEVLQDFKELEITIGNIQEIKWGTKRMTRAMGYCKRKINKKDYEYSIKISPIIDGNDEAVKEVLCHEILHTVKDCFNHGSEFKRVGNILACKGYHVSRCFNPKSFDNFEYAYEIRQKEIVIACVDCGHEWIYHRECNATRYPETYTCPYCGSHPIRKETR